MTLARIRTAAGLLRELAADLRALARDMTTDLAALAAEIRADLARVRSTP